ncbi:hypothetical protein SAMN03080617_04406 [Algoriphagus alkaliphilus]|uniref:Uncharacterized protein n=1 Tax=Algoriphagus alkaliphilus TaxID=279824 RepID=A0A1G5ZSK6_9BACT|nr:hypothetical protein [Algoriphagus alkaliphilus]SDA97769.1 hypothetical protein SAMN03080617_04406 [Algoriphagus alkaliphilus]
MDDDNFYEARLDKIFGNGSMWKHRTFRTILDPFSSEWNGTDYDKKIEILEKVVAASEDLEMLISEYKERYDEQNRKDISSSVESALTKLLQYRLTK